MRFANGHQELSRIVDRVPPTVFELVYFGSPTLFSVKGDSQSCVVELRSTVSAEEFDVVNAGWVSVLLNFKAVAEHGIDLRNHNQKYSWDFGFVDN